MYIIWGETDDQPRLDAWENCVYFISVRKSSLISLLQKPMSLEFCQNGKHRNASMTQQFHSWVYNPKELKVRCADLKKKKKKIHEWHWFKISESLLQSYSYAVQALSTGCLELNNL